MLKTVFLALVIVAPSAYAQGRPASPGNPAAPVPVTVVDSDGTVVGEVIEVAGRTHALVKYVLADQNYVALRVTSHGLTGVQNANLVAPFGASPQQAKVFFKTADCSGEAFVPTHIPGITAQLTKRQGITLFMFENAPPPPNSCPNVSLAGGGSYLYATDPLACPMIAAEHQPVTFQAFLGQSSNGTSCVQATVSAPTQLFQHMFTVYKPIENLTTKFTAPFYVP